MPVKNAPATMFPIVTGTWFHSHHLLQETGAPSIMPEGITYMLTIECSYPCAKNVRIGSHMATTLPIVERDENARIAPSVTIQLHNTPLITAVAHPLGPRTAYATVFFSAICRSC